MQINEHKKNGKNLEQDAGDVVASLLLVLHLVNYDVMRREEE